MTCCGVATCACSCGGQAVSQAGDWLYSVALIVYVLDATGSAAWVAAVELARLVPWIVLPPFAGLVADRVSRRRVLIGCDLVQFGAMLGLAAVAAAGGDPAVAITVAVVAGIAQVVASPSLQAAVPALVDERSLGAVNALLSAIMNLAIVVGPAVGAVLLAPRVARGGLRPQRRHVRRVRGRLRAGARADGPARRRERRDGVDGRCGETTPATRAGPAGRPRRPRSAPPRWTSRRGSGPCVARRPPLAVVLVSAGGMFAYGMQVVLWAILAEERLTAGSDAITLLYVANGIGGLIATIPAVARREPAAPPRSSWRRAPPSEACPSWPSPRRTAWHPPWP